MSEFPPTPFSNGTPDNLPENPYLRQLRHNASDSYGEAVHADHVNLGADNQPLGHYQQRQPGNQLSQYYENTGQDLED